MHVRQSCWTGAQGWRPLPGGETVRAPQLVLYFGACDPLADGTRYDELRALYPDAHLLGCSTGGEILDDDVYDDTIVAAAVQFDNTRVELAQATATARACSTAIGRQLGEALNGPDLSAVFVLSDGMRVNGSELVAGINETVPANVVVTGGMAGDSDRFDTTLVGIDGAPAPGGVGAIGFYGDHVAVGHGSFAGWSEFGPQRVITRSDANVLYELDGRPALELYKTYRGDEAAHLPGSALLFPLKVQATPEADNGVVRTIIGVDEAAQSMTFAGNMPQGYMAQLMHGNFETLIDGAATAAEQAVLPPAGDRLAILISCIGRKLALGQRTGEEVEAVRDALGGDLPQIGFYSYGEISPHAALGHCALHNQTMTVTVLSET